MKNQIHSHLNSFPQTSQLSSSGCFDQNGSRNKLRSYRGDIFIKDLFIEFIIVDASHALLQDFSLWEYMHVCIAYHRFMSEKLKLLILRPPYL